MPILPTLFKAGKAASDLFKKRKTAKTAQAGSLSSLQSPTLNQPASPVDVGAINKIAAQPTPLATGTKTTTPQLPTIAPQVTAPQAPPQPTFQPGGALPQVTQPVAPVAPVTPALPPTTPPLPTPPTGAAPGEVQQAAVTEQTRERLVREQAARQQANQAPPISPDVPRETQTAVSAAEQALFQSQQISPEELSTQADLDRLAESTNKGFAKIKGQTIALPFITGKLRAVQQQALDLQEPLQRKLARLQAARVASVSASKFALDRADKKATQARSDRQQQEENLRELEQAEQGEIREFGGKLLRVFPDGRTETLAEEEQAAAKGFTLSPGQVRFDAQGNVVASGQEDARTGLQLQKLQLEVQKAQQTLSQSGQQLSPEQLQDAISKGYTTSADLELYSKISFGGAVPPAKLSAEMRKLQPSVKSGINDIQFLRDNIAGRFVPGFLGNKQFKAAISNVTDVVGRLRSGGAITEDELKTFRELLPKSTDSKDTAISKLDRIEGIFKEFLGDTGAASPMGLQQETFQDINLGADFSREGSVSQQRSTIGNERLRNGKTSLNIGAGTVTGIDGSSLWKHGLDFVLKGGFNAPVPSPVSGTVVFADVNGGFGNQVKIRKANGEEVWTSHLNGMNVQPGQQVNEGEVIGRQGNSGSVLGGRGEKLTSQQVASGRGTHLDITIKKPDGSFYRAREVAALLGDSRINNLG